MVCYILIEFYSLLYFIEYFCLLLLDRQFWLNFRLYLTDGLLFLKNGLLYLIDGLLYLLDGLSYLLDGLLYLIESYGLLYFDRLLWFDIPGILIESYGLLYLTAYSWASYV